MKYIAVYIGSNLEFNFFSRMTDSLTVLGYDLIFLSNKISIIVKAWIHRKKYFIIKKNNLVENIPNLSKCFDIKNGSTSIDEANVLYSSVFNAFNVIRMRYNIEYIFIWNGLSIQTIAASDLALKATIKTRFFELSNIPGKIFVNPIGVNAKSSLYKNLVILDHFISDETEYELWKKQYIDLKQRQLVPPQTKVKKVQNYWFFIDLIGFHFLNLPKNGEVNIFRKFKSVLKSRVSIQYDKYDLFINRFIFLPLQVNSDSQLVFNSMYSNIDALLFGIHLALERKADLVVKIHPAEMDDKFVLALKKIKGEQKFFLVNYSTFDLVTNSLLVLTINSTVGLEAIILNKNVMFLGHSIYSQMHLKQIQNYILRYLIDADYFSENKINVMSVKKIIDII